MRCLRRTRVAAVAIGVELHQAHPREGLVELAALERLVEGLTRLAPRGAHVDHQPALLRLRGLKSLSHHRVGVALAGRHEFGPHRLLRACDRGIGHGDRPSADIGAIGLAGADAGHERAEGEQGAGLAAGDHRAES